MLWYAYLAYFFAGVFLANGIPHFMHGISGFRFPTPFASPPCRGESSALVNVGWGLVNFIIGYVLIYRVGEFVLGWNRGTVMVGIGVIVCAMVLALSFQRMRAKP